MINEATLALQEETGRIGNWIRVHTGGRYYPLDPRLDEIHIEDIIWSLPMLCRYNGHIDRFYSVAEHSWLLSYAVPPEYAFEALLHDASEAYMSDIPRPLKYADELIAFRKIEDNNTRYINNKFGILNGPYKGSMYCTFNTSDVVKEYDKRIVANEKKELFSGIDADFGVDPLPDIEIMGFYPDVMRQKFEDRFIELKKEHRFRRAYNG